MKLIKVLMVILTLFLVSCETPYDPDIHGRIPVYQAMEIDTDYAIEPVDDVLIPSIPFEIPETLEPINNEGIYYAIPSEDVYVHINIFNPDGQVILRFTLNDIMYQSYQFEEGSTSETLIIKIQAPEMSGLHQLTIDEIKYVENETNEVKDVIFGGVQTIQLGVTYTKHVEINNLEMSLNIHTLHVKGSIIDTEDILTKDQSQPKLYLFDHEGLVYTKALDTSYDVTYPYLHPDQVYYIAIAVPYDMLDGQGIMSRLLYTEEIQTDHYYDITISNISSEAFTWDASLKGDTVDSNLSSVTLKDENEDVTNIASQTISNLLSHHTYTLRFTYAYSFDNDTVTYASFIDVDVSTLEKVTPEVSLGISNITNSSVELQINALDPDGIIVWNEVTLYDLNGLLETFSYASPLIIDGLSANTNYYIEVSYSYDLNEGEGIQTATVSSNEVMNLKDALTVAEGLLSQDLLFVVYGEVIDIFEENGFDWITISSGNATADVYLLNDTYTPELGHFIIGTFNLEDDTFHGGRDLMVYNPYFKTLEE